MNRKKMLLKSLSVIFIAVIGFDLLFYLRFLSVDPVLNNIFILFANVCIGFAIIYFLVVVFKKQFKKIIRMFLIFILSVVIIIITAITLFLDLYNFKSYTLFEYNSKIYYYENVGWLAPEYNVYEKYGRFKIRKIHSYYNETFPEKIDDKIAEEIISGKYKNRSVVKDTHSIDETKISDFEKTPQNLLDENALLKNVIRIPNSKFGIVSVDKAMSRNRCFFVKLSEDKMYYISEIPETVELKEYKLMSDEAVYLKFEDSNGNISECRSFDGGKNWIE